MYSEAGLPNAVDGFLSGLVFELHFRDTEIQTNLSVPSSNNAVRGFLCLGLGWIWKKCQVSLVENDT